MRPENGESVREDALESVKQQISRRPDYHPAPTPLQCAMQLLAAAYIVAVEKCDERQLDAFLFAACTKAARESSRRLPWQEHRRAA